MHEVFWSNALNKWLFGKCPVFTSALAQRIARCGHPGQWVMAIAVVQMSCHDSSHLYISLHFINVEFNLFMHNISTLAHKNEAKAPAPVETTTYCGTSAADLANAPTYEDTQAILHWIDVHGPVLGPYEPDNPNAWHQLAPTNEECTERQSTPALQGYPQGQHQASSRATPLAFSPVLTTQLAPLQPLPSVGSPTQLTDGRYSPAHSLIHTNNDSQVNMTASASRRSFSRSTTPFANVTYPLPSSPMTAPFLGSPGITDAGRHSPVVHAEGTFDEQPMQTYGRQALQHQPFPSMPIVGPSTPSNNGRHFQSYTTLDDKANVLALANEGIISQSPTLSPANVTRLLPSSSLSLGTVGSSTLSNNGRHFQSYTTHDDKANVLALAGERFISQSPTLSPANVTRLLPSSSLSLGTADNGRRSPAVQAVGDQQWRQRSATASPIPSPMFFHYRPDKSLRARSRSASFSEKPLTPPEDNAASYPLVTKDSFIEVSGPTGRDKGFLSEEGPGTPPLIGIQNVLPIAMPIPQAQPAPDPTPTVKRKRSQSLNASDARPLKRAATISNAMGSGSAKGKPRTLRREATERAAAFHATGSQTNVMAPAAPSIPAFAYSAPQMLSSGPPQVVYYQNQAPFFSLPFPAAGQIGAAQTFYAA
ncbi:hypothetical protein D9615_003255 [Tricholomella constricta]|uniref:Uncharacterized protein n=1 Tax=Tricholomella constricta TaxID=117010 RepID=A0A8H5M7T9_9AGAR|nr:hypothetical protein D9615_003255 [Tricholomella constricta]